MPSRESACFEYQQFSTSAVRRLAALECTPKLLRHGTPDASIARLRRLSLGVCFASAGKLCAEAKGTSIEQHGLDF